MDTSNAPVSDLDPRVIAGDAFEILPRMSERFDAVITDPPFFMPAAHYQSRTREQRSWSDTTPMREFFRSMLSVIVPRIKSTGHFVCFCNHESFAVLYPEVYGRFDRVRSLVWSKGRIGMGSGWRNSHELIVAACWSDAEYHQPPKFPDVLTCSPVHKSKRRHPVEKPVALLEDLVTMTVPAGGSVLDPFAGGGSLGRAARRQGRRSVLVELGEDSVAAIKSRLDQGRLDD